VGVPRPPVHLVSANVGQNLTLPANGRIELGFDRLLLPASISRQTFVLENAGNTKGYTPTIAYDPVARIVTITPLTDPTQALVSGQSYDIVILAPQSASDVNGLRAIDGATLAPPSPRVIAFSVTDPTPTPPSTVSIDFCRDISPITGSCVLSQCHLGGPMSTPAAGLVLYPYSGIPATAVGRVAQGSNTGPQSMTSPPSLLFGEDMPIIDPTGDPGNSWTMYKVLLAVPSPEAVAVDAGAGAEDAGGQEAGAPDATTDASSQDAATDAGAPDASATPGADAGAADASPDADEEAGPAAPPPPPPVSVSGAHSIPWQGISDAERASLSNYILGREMPFPPSFPPLTLDDMERLSLWITQGAGAPATCP
jgi:hypothetical protein